MMRRQIALCAVTVLCAGCAADQPVPTAVELRVPVFAAGGNRGVNLGTHLTGNEEVFTPATSGAPTPADSRAQGQAIFRVSDDGTSVDYKLIVANIENVFMAHIHTAAAGVNGPIVVWLYPSTAPVQGLLGQGRINGVIAEGTFTAANLVGPLTGHPLADLLAAIRSGGAYVNAHTNDGVTPTNTGPGDFPGGEIRGQLTHGR
jgi:CHRD domain-containing protein